MKRIERYCLSDEYMLALVAYFMEEKSILETEPWFGKTNLTGMIGDCLLINTEITTLCVLELCFRA